MTYVFSKIGEQKEFTLQTISTVSKVVADAITLEDIITDTKNLKYKGEVATFKAAVQAATEPKKVKKEDYIPSFLPHAWVNSRVKLKDAAGNIDHDKWMSTEIVHIDLDGIAANKMHTVIKKIDSLKPLARFRSPSGNGLKVFFQHDSGELTHDQRVNFRNALRRVIRGVLIQLDLAEHYDFSPTNANRQCYYSFDVSAMYNKDHMMFPLSTGYAELEELAARQDVLKAELASLVCTVQNTVDASELDKHIQRVFQKRLHTCSGTGNTQSFALACELVRCGLTDADITQRLEHFRSLRNGDWTAADKVRAARQEVGTERNRYASETIDVDSGVDTKRYEEITLELRHIRADILATTANVDSEITNELALSLINQRIPLSDELVRCDNEYYEQARAIHTAVQVSKVVTVVENAGSGKSRTMGELAKLINADLQGGDHTWNGMVFATNTRANRDAFANANPYFSVVKGVIEIIFDITESKAAQIRAAEIYSEDFILEENDKRSVIDSLLQESIITEQQAKAIRAESLSNAEKLKGAFLAICHAKMRCGGLVARFMRHVVVMDEMAADDVVALGENDKIKAYQKVEVEVQEEELIAEDEVKFFMEKISQRHDSEGNSIGGVVMLSAEKSLLRAFGTDEMPNIRLKGMFGNITVKHLGKPKTLIDNNFQVVVVDTLSNNFATKKTSTTARDKMANLLRAEGYYVICDGKREDDTSIGDVTIEGCKGSNDMMSKKTAVLISDPHPFEVGYMMMRLNCDESTAVSVIVSDKANQAIGRNVGYRNRGAECLLVVGAGVHSADKTLTLDVISNNCFYARKRTDVDSLPAKLQGVFSEWLNDDDAVCYKVARDLCDAVFMQGATVETKELKTTVREVLASNGVAKTRIDRGGLIKTTLNQLAALGVNVVTKEKMIEGKRTKISFYALR